MTIPTHIGRYEVLGLLGTGGMAEVFLGRIVGPAGFKRPVVIKRILPHLGRQQSFVDMFLDEARIVARIRHGNVVQVQELCQEPDNLYIVMEYLEGESLDGIIRRLISHRRLLEYGLAAHIISEIGMGLHAAHELTDEHGVPQNLVHRDVSPANIFVTYDGHVKILDFGIATAADRLSRTSAGQVKGKYPYMSPEQCRGYALDRRSDIFSLGIVLFELTTCRRLFKRVNEVETATAIISGQVPRPSTFVPGYPEDLERVLFRALSVDPNLRYPNAMEMRRELVEVTHSDGKGAHADERLGLVMQRLFEDRIEEKRAMLRKVASGDAISIVPAAETDEAVVVPDAKLPAVSVPPGSPSTPGTPSSPSTPRIESTSPQPLSELPVAAPITGPRKIGAPVAGALAVAGAVTAIVLAWSAFDSDARTKTQLEESATAVKTATVAKAAERIELEIITVPAGAKVSIAGEQRGITPLTLSLEKTKTELAVSLDHAGYKPLVEKLVPDRDQRVRLSLVAKPKPVVQPTDPQAPKPDDEAVKSPYRKFD